jgi:hypothetical protein
MATVTYLPSALDAQINSAADRIKKEQARNRVRAALVLLASAAAMVFVAYTALH